jgi:hypothetical protein
MSLFGKKESEPETQGVGAISVRQAINMLQFNRESGPASNTFTCGRCGMTTPGGFAEHTCGDTPQARSFDAAAKRTREVQAAEARQKAQERKVKFVCECGSEINQGEGHTCAVNAAQELERKRLIRELERLGVTVQKGDK